MLRIKRSPRRWSVLDKETLRAAFAPAETVDTIIRWVRNTAERRS